MALKDWKKIEHGLYKNTKNLNRIKIACWHYGVDDKVAKGYDVFLNDGKRIKKLNKIWLSSFSRALKFAKSYMKEN